MFHTLRGSTRNYSVRRTNVNNIHSNGDWKEHWSFVTETFSFCQAWHIDSRFSLSMESSHAPNRQPLGERQGYWTRTACEFSVTGFSFFSSTFNVIFLYFYFIFYLNVNKRRMGYRSYSFEVISLMVLPFIFPPFDSSFSPISVCYFINRQYRKDFVGIRYRWSRRTCTLKNMFIASRNK